MSDNGMFMIILSILILGAMLAVEKSLRRRPLLFNFVVALASGLVTSTVVTLVVRRLGYIWYDFDGLASSILFVLCLFRLPELFFQGQVSRHNLLYQLTNYVIFSFAYAISYCVVTNGLDQHVGLMTVGVATAGLLGGVVSRLFQFNVLPTTLLNLLVNLLRRRGRILGRLILALILVATAVLVSSWSKRALAYGVRYQSKGETITEWATAIDTYYNLAFHYRDRGDIDTAVVLSRHSTIVNPSFYDGYLQQADLLMRQGRYGAAVAVLDTAISMDPNNASAYYGRAFAYESLGDYGHAIQDLGRIISLKPDDGSVYLARAAMSVYNGDHAQALVDSDKVRQISSSSVVTSTADLIKGMVYLGNRDMERAKIALKNWGKKSDKHDISYFEGALSSSVPISTRLAYDRSTGLIWNAIHFFPILRVDDYPHIPLGRVAFSVGSPSVAWDSLSDRFSSNLSTLKYMTPYIDSLAMSSVPSSAIVIYQTWASLYDTQNQPKVALGYFRRAWELASLVGDVPSQLDALKGIAKSSTDLGETQVACRAYEQIVALTQQQDVGPDDLVDIYYKLGLLNLKEKRFEIAIDNFSQVLKLNPNHKDALIRRAEAYYQVSKLDNAIADVRQSIRVAPDWLEAYLALGRYLAIAGEYQQALDTLFVIQSRSKDNPMYYHYLGYVYLAGGNRSLALDAYDQSFRLVATKLASADKADLYKQIADDLRDLSSSKPSASSNVNDVLIMMRGVISIDTSSSSLWYTKLVPARATEESNPYGCTSVTVPALPLPSMASLPPTQTLWLQLAVVGPQQIRPGSSGIVEIVAELRDSPEYGGTAFPVDLCVGHTYSAYVQLTTLNFDVGGETNSANLIHQLQIGKPVRWQWILSPKPGYEGDQSVIYDIVVRDVDSNSNWSREIPTNSIVITVPTPYGIPANLLYPLSGVLAALGAILALPIWKAIYTAWKEHRKKGEEKSQILISKN